MVPKAPICYPPPASSAPTCLVALRAMARAEHWASLLATFCSSAYGGPGGLLLTKVPSADRKHKAAMVFFFLARLLLSSVHFTN
ncbi:hypothetical protein N658DRAFT_500584 [Parathielavia hyrcaniae]|uniref:Uncharacterized protein n=1 Tax=Parathielavia hyrcaniae TaxID=113614 RepID=A0AAN6PV97_9PEZI|nr:hypothetical protein N658DRAFT_500584 [Parathielavia hyrcaniae]